MTEDEWTMENGKQVDKETRSLKRESSFVIRPPSSVGCAFSIVHCSFICRLLSAVCGLVLVGCSVFVPPDAGMGNAGLDTAAAALERASPPEPGEQRVYVTKFMPNSALVVFRNIGGQTPFSVGYGYLSRAGMDWQMHEGGMRGGSAPPRNGGPILLDISAPEDPPNYTIVVGSLLDERVRFVQITFADGQIKTDTVMNGLTGIFLEPKTTVCHLQLLDANNNMLFDFELAKDPPELELAFDLAEWAQKECV